MHGSTWGWKKHRSLGIAEILASYLENYILTQQTFIQQLVLWCSWLSLLSNTQAVPGSSPGGIIAFAARRIAFGSWNVMIYHVGG